eukprot:gene25269-biopygen7478
MIPETKEARSDRATRASRCASARCTRARSFGHAWASRMLITQSRISPVPFHNAPSRCAAAPRFRLRRAPSAPKLRCWREMEGNGGKVEGKNGSKGDRARVEGQLREVEGNGGKTGGRGENG